MRKATRRRNVAARHVIGPRKQLETITTHLTPHRHVVRRRSAIPDLQVLVEQQVAERIFHRGAKLRRNVR